MQKPYRFTAIHQMTGEIKEFNEVPITWRFEEWLPISDKVSVNVMLWDFYEDMRYKAKLRLWRYINKMPPPKPYGPLAGTEIGKTIPILNF